MIRIESKNCRLLEEEGEECVGGTQLTMFTVSMVLRLVSRSGEPLVRFVLIVEKMKSYLVEQQPKAQKAEEGNMEGLFSHDCAKIELCLECATRVTVKHICFLSHPAPAIVAFTLPSSGISDELWILIKQIQL